MPRTAEVRSLAGQLAKLETIRKHYVEQLAATERARGALTRQFEEYMSAGNPLALEISALDEEWRRFAEDDLPAAHLFVGMLQALGIETSSFGGAEGPLEGFFA